MLLRFSFDYEVALGVRDCPLARCSVYRNIRQRFARLAVHHTGTIRLLRRQRQAEEEEVNNDNTFHDTKIVILIHNLSCTMKICCEAARVLSTLNDYIPHTPCRCYPRKVSHNLLASLPHVAFLLFIPEQRAVCGLPCGFHLYLRRATVII